METMYWCVYVVEERSKDGTPWAGQDSTEAPDSLWPILQAFCLSVEITNAADETDAIRLVADVSFHKKTLKEADHSCSRVHFWKIWG